MPRKPRLLGLVISVAGSLIVTGWGSAAGSARTLGTHATSPVIDPVSMRVPELRAEARLLHEPFFWAGTEKGYRYEFRRTAMDDVYVRYLPAGVPAGASGAKYLIVATYPVRGAFSKVKRQAGGSGIAGPRGSIIFVDPSHPKSVFLAFPGIDYEIEIYDHRPATALAVAESGQVRRVKPAHT